MSDGPNLTDSPAVTADAGNGQVSQHGDEERLKYAQEQWIDYCAIGGLTTKADGTVGRESVNGFASRHFVSKQTLYNWKREVPNFNARVAKRRMELGTDTRLTAVINAIYATALKGNPTAQTLYLGIFAKHLLPNQQTPADQRRSLSELFGKAESRRKQIESTALEGEIMPAGTPHAA